MRVGVFHSRVLGRLNHSFCPSNVFPTESGSVPRPALERKSWVLQKNAAQGCAHRASPARTALPWVTVQEPNNSKGVPPNFPRETGRKLRVKYSLDEK